MTDDRHERRLSRAEVKRIRKQLREHDGDNETVLARIGRVISYPPASSGNVKRYRFGMALIVLAVFQLVLFFVLPDDDRRWLFIGFAVLTAAVGARQIDLAKER